MTDRNEPLPHRLVLHADDLGMSRAVSGGIIQGFREGILTSTSVLANGPDFQEAMREWRALVPSPSPARAALADVSTPYDLGVHLNLTQGYPLSDNFPARLRDRRGAFLGIGRLALQMVTRPARYRGAIREEWRGQIARVRDLGVPVTHLNGHQYVEMLPGILPVFCSLANEFSIPIVRCAREPLSLRTLGVTRLPLALAKRFFGERASVEFSRRGVAHADAYVGANHAGKVTPGLILEFLRACRSPWQVEIGVHPGRHADPLPIDDPWHDPLSHDRPNELAWLISIESAKRLAERGVRLSRLSALRERPSGRRSA